MNISNLLKLNKDVENLKNNSKELDQTIDTERMYVIKQKLFENKENITTIAEIISGLRLIFELENSRNINKNVNKAIRNFAFPKHLNFQKNNFTFYFTNNEIKDGNLLKINENGIFLNEKMFFDIKNREFFIDEEYIKEQNLSEYLVDSLEKLPNLRKQFENFLEENDLVKKQFSKAEKFLESEKEKEQKIFDEKLKIDEKLKADIEKELELKAKKREEFEKLKAKAVEELTIRIEKMSEGVKADKIEKMKKELKECFIDEATKKYPNLNLNEENTRPKIMAMFNAFVDSISEKLQFPDKYNPKALVEEYFAGLPTEKDVIPTPGDDDPI